MDPVVWAIISIVAVAASEILPFTPLRSNGIIQLILEILTKISGEYKKDDTPE